MKKILTITLAIAMILTMGSIPAFATTNTITTNGGTDNHGVFGTYQTGGAAATKYSVDVTWDSLQFTYTAASEGTWDPETHVY